jgi:hypothetical protein
MNNHNRNGQPRSSRFSLFELMSSGSSPMSTSHIIDLISDYNNNIRDMLRLLERADDGRLEQSPQLLTPLFDISLNTTLSQNQISSYTTCYNFSVDASGNELTCPITMEQIRDNDAVMRINRCGHIFKESALRSWLARNNRCPVCRSNVAPQ